MLRVILFAAVFALGAAPLAQAETRKSNRVDSEHLFGFVEGADIGELKETEIESETIGRFGKGSGSYSNAATAVEIKHTLLENLRISAAAAFAYAAMSGVNGLGDSRRTAMQGVAVGMRYRVLDRAHAPVGLTLSVEPRWSFVDDVSNAPADRQSAVFLLLADRELVPGRVFGAVNLLYEPERTRLRGSGEIDHESTFGAGAALTAQIAPGVFLGGEARYLRRYEGLTLNAFAGQALYAGPTLYAALGGPWWLSAAWDVQVWGAAASRSDALDLTHFERHQVKFRLGFSF
ncbi:MAG: hypothetical protein AB1490_12465 [Pseudomonadota bacterium]